jgi:hypothetical protein
MNAESPYDTVLEDNVTGYGDDALEDRVTEYGTLTALANKAAKAPRSGMSRLFVAEVDRWVQRNEKKVFSNAFEALYPVADIYDLMFPGEDPQDQIKKAVGLAIGKKASEYVQKLIKLPPLLEAAKKLIEKGFEKLKEDTEKEERLAKRQFIENYRVHQKFLQEELRRQIRGQAGRWFQQVDSAQDKPAEEAKITPLLAETNDLEVQPVRQEVQLSDAMKDYWGMQYPFAIFEHPATQPIPTDEQLKLVRPVAPPGVPNFRDVIKAIKGGDSNWNTVQDRTIVIKWSADTQDKYPPGGGGRAPVESYLITHKKLLEDSQ